MRSLIVGVGLVLVACKGGGPGPGKAGGGAAGDLAARTAIIATLPKVTDASATWVPTSKPPELLVLVDADGTIRLAEAPDSWATLASRDPRAKASKPLDLDTVQKSIKEGRIVGYTGDQVLKHLADGDTLDLGSDRAPTTTQDDPPPPPEEDEDDGEDESGGTGTAMALEEGKMGRHDRTPPAPPGPRQGHLGGGGFASLSGDDPDPNARPGELAKAGAAFVRDGVLARDPYAIVLPHPDAKASVLVGLAEWDPAADLIGVVVGGEVRLLRLAFARWRDAMVVEPVPWLEVRMWPVGLDLEAVPDVPSSVPWQKGQPLDVGAVAAAYQAARAKRSLTFEHQVDILVSPDTTVQQLIDVIVALDKAGATVIGLGAVPAKGDPEAGKRGHRTPRVEIAASRITGDADWLPLNDALATRLGSIEGCYLTLLEATPNAAGTIEVTYVYTAKGRVKSVQVTGLDDPTFTACVAKVFEQTTFPAPRTAGNVQVTTRLTLTN